MLPFSSDAADSAARVAAVYLLASGLWILTTDFLTGAVARSSAELTLVQTTKGMAFVTLSAALLFVLVGREQRRLASANADLERALQHASVLHRLLRHNLRNSSDVIRNNAALLRREGTDADAARARIERQADSLAAIAEKSRHLRDVVFDDDLEPVALDLSAAVAESVATARDEFPETRIEVECPESVRVVAHPRLAVGVGELLTNAVTHHDGETPRISVTVESGSDWASVSVADDGPGLPAVERVVLEEGVEDALAHSTGIGLWMVRFIVTDSDGSIAVEEEPVDGTVVRLRLPIAET